MLDLVLREIKEKLMNPALGLLRRYRFSPNYLSLVGFVCGLACGIALMKEDAMWGLALWALNRFFDGIDGSYARLTGQ